MAWDTRWDAIFRSQPWGRYPGEELIRFVARNFYDRPNRAGVKLLEVGCGPGANLWFCAREGFAVYGIDGSSHAIELARQRLDQECPGWVGRLDVGDCVHVSHPDATFDGAIDNEAVCHNDFESARSIYQEIARVLVPGGKLFVRTFATGTTGDGTGEALGRGAWRVSAGPMLGKGLSRFTAAEDFKDLFEPPLAIVSCDLLTRTSASGHELIREWILHLQTAS